MTVPPTSRITEPEEAHGASVPMPHHATPYMKVFVALMILTLITVGIGIYYRARLEVINVLLALAVALVKGSLVALYFMHLKYEGKLIYLIFISPLVLCVLLIMALLPDIVSIGEGSMTQFNMPALYQPAHGH